MRTYHARVRVNGRLIQTSIMASSTLEARQLLERLYGRGSVSTTPVAR